MSLLWNWASNGFRFQASALKTCQMSPSILRGIKSLNRNEGNHMQQSRRNIVILKALNLQICFWFALSVVRLRIVQFSEHRVCTFKPSFRFALVQFWESLVPSLPELCSAQVQMLILITQYWTLSTHASYNVGF